MEGGKLYLIPTPLGDNEPREVLPEAVIQRVLSLRVFIVEELRSARRFLSRIGFKGQIESLEFHEFNEHSSQADLLALEGLFEENEDVGLLSEAGLPAVADPGAEVVAMCHKKGVGVVPLSGPSSIMLALMASGLNGQAFSFHGYIPIKTDQRRSRLKELERQSAMANSSQIIIETPYRNDALLSDMLEVLSPRTMLCIAADLTLPSQYMRNDSIENWKKSGFEIGKRPCVFILLAKNRV